MRSMWSVGKFIATRSPPSIPAHPARAGASKHPPRGRRWRIRRGLFPPDFFPGSDWWRVRGPHEPSRRRALRIRSECRELESFLEPPEAMPFGNEMFLLGRSPARTELREIVVEALLHLVVENYPEISASLPLDLLRGLLIEPVEIGIVVGFAGFGESVVENLTFAGPLRLGEEPMGVLGEGEQLARAHFLMRNGLHFDEALAHEIFDIRPHAPFVPAVGKLGEIFLRNSTEFAEFHHRCGFG